MANLGGQFRLTKEESAVMDECRKNSFWYRSVPLMAITSAIMTYRRVNLQTQPKFYGLKIAGGLLGAYLLGKASYISECRQLILQRLPESNLARTIESKQLDLISDMAQPPEIVPKNATTGIFGNRSNEEEDQFQFLNPPNEQSEKTATTRKYVTYDELRERNRAEFASKFSGLKPRTDSPPTTSTPAPSNTRSSRNDDRSLAVQPIVSDDHSYPSAPPSPPSSNVKKSNTRKNQYGDEVYD